MRGEVVRCAEKRCKGRQDALIKPDIVFFGASSAPFRPSVSGLERARAHDVLLLFLGLTLPSLPPFPLLLSRPPSLRLSLARR